ncbi:uncharacterized protein DUF3644 [Barrientosiimonas humi]|uniref:Uncharacterized protein DUF3644 n=1 Tax=Barrientosiimonas humi TaxID=999931 RepID=A0A542X8K2_9MICO|nr:DUF3644 domain-containing protein [Barrientosiimonas humi]TQL32163.1 uncharacterized protein DUF3644 [Barrientosiimonas humi]CAG7572151.1 hypothetical protein BH39T_PBIAJDOK_00761 [Barrientosiimonas humi]
MARPPRWQTTLDASIEEACLAVRLYNDPAEARAFEGFVVHMHLAWLYLLHAEFIRDGVDYRYWNKKHTRLERIDGEPKRWELERCLKERWEDRTEPVPANLRLFIGLRNRLEHRHAHADRALMLNLAGHSHALLINYENEVTSEFGDSYSLALRLRIPLFVGTFSEQGERALRQFRKTLPTDLQGFLTEYFTDLGDDLTDDPRFEFRLRATMELAPKDPDAVAIQYTHINDMTDEEKATVEEMGRRGQVIVRDRRQPVSGMGMLLPKPAAQEVQDGLPYVFNVSHFVSAYKRLNVRPEPGSPNAEHTNADWCAYHEPTGTYLYTRAFVKYLIKKCSTPEGFEATTGRKPKPLS